jgi:hypothetical protein
MPRAIAFCHPQKLHIINSLIMEKTRIALLFPFKFVINIQQHTKKIVVHWFKGIIKNKLADLAA